LSRLFAYLARGFIALYTGVNRYIPTCTLYSQAKRRGQKKQVHLAHVLNF